MILKVLQDQIEGASFRANYLTYTYTRIQQVDLGLDPYADTTTPYTDRLGKPGYGDQGGAFYILQARLDPAFPQIGQYDVNDPTNEFFRASIKDMSVEPWDRDSTCLLRVAQHYEGSTGKVLWSTNGSLSALPWNFDRNGALVRVPYKFPDGGNFGITNTQMPNVAHMTRRVPLGSYDATFYVNGPGTGDLLREKLLGRVNESRWTVIHDFSGSLTGTSFDARTQLCARVQNTTENGVLYRVQVTFLEMPELTWDELSIYLDAQQKKLSGTDPIPGVTTYATDDTTFGNGWIRTRLQGEANFNKYLISENSNPAYMGV